MRKRIEDEESKVCRSHRPEDKLANCFSCTANSSGLSLLTNCMRQTKTPVPAAGVRQLIIMVIVIIIIMTIKSQNELKALTFLFLLRNVTLCRVIIEFHRTLSFSKHLKIFSSFQIKSSRPTLFLSFFFFFSFNYSKIKQEYN